MDKSALFKARFPEADVEIGIGKVRVRGLSRAEVMKIAKAADAKGVDGDRGLALEQKMLFMAMVEPELTEAEVAEWYEMATVGELEPVIEKVQELSGMLQGQSKSDLS